MHPGSPPRTWRMKDSVKAEWRVRPLEAMRAAPPCSRSMSTTTSDTTRPSCCARHKPNQSHSAALLPVNQHHHVGHRQALMLRRGI